MIEEYRYTDEQFRGWLTRGKKVNGEYVSGCHATGYMVPGEGFVIFFPCTPENEHWNNFFAEGE